ncbi:MAG TPA: amidohydrolase family protein [Stellaceae bacterium]|nr:amidohydrolase family protein [Stellaceae bacterium]
MTESPRPPRLQAPPFACDTHMHIYEKRFPILPDAVPPPEAPVAAYRAVQRRLGIARAVIVQPNAYGKDNRCTLEAIAALGLDTARGIAVIDEATPDAEIEHLTRAGIRGIRFHLMPRGYLGWDVIEALSARVQPFGWHSQIQLDGRSFPEREAVLRRLPGTIVVDHVGRFHDPVPPEHPAFQSLLRLIDTGRFWVKLSAPYESLSREGPPRWGDVGALAKALVAHAPERMLWASNWPHPGQPTLPDDADLLDLLLDWAPDEATRRRILVDNPAALYGFKGAPRLRAAPGCGGR